MGEEEKKSRGRNLRSTERIVYDDRSETPSENERGRDFNMEEKLKSNSYNHKHIKELKGPDLRICYFQKNGFSTPILVKDKTGLGLRVPSKNFTVMDVKACVGGRRILDVMDVESQNSLHMSVKDWIEYYTKPESRTKLLNVISLEFSHTKLSTYVEQPTVIRQIDWVDCVWPLHLKDSQSEGTNALDKMKYPKVQKYCLMSVKGCYTDFHIDMSGTSVWYHVLHGSKFFWMIPPTSSNLQIYENWVMSGKQNRQFFADLVPDCQRVRLSAGWTFFIPTGWIHGVYTPEDSLVFGGNFLHSFNIPLQIEIASLEDRTLVQNKFKFPFFTEMMWYCAERYCSLLLNPPLRSVTPENQGTPEEIKKEDGSTESETQTQIKKETLNDLDLKEEAKESPDVKEIKPKVPKKIYMTPFEIEGLDILINWLENLPSNKRHVPSEVRNAPQLLKKLKELVDQHRNDPPELAISDEPLLAWPARKRGRGMSNMYSSCTGSRIMKRSKGINRLGPNTPNGSNGVESQIGDKGKGSHHHRRVRCKKCEPCTRTDCGECHFCKDMRKFGGPGRMKQTCISRQCMAPLLPSTAACYYCDSGEGREAPPYLDDIQEANDLLMECSICWKISHPRCIHAKDSSLPAGGLCEDLPASWECPFCQKNSSKIHKEAWTGDNPVSEDGIASVPSPPEAATPCPKILSLNEYLNANRLSEVVVRPAPIVPPPLYVKQKGGGYHVFEKEIWQRIFEFLDKKSLVNTMCACKAFCRWLMDRRYWYSIDVSGRPLNTFILTGIVRRQPLSVNLSNTNVSREQLEWLLMRLPHLEHLFIGSNSMAGCSALAKVHTSRLRTLDLSWMEGLHDDAIRLLLPTPSLTAISQKLKFISGISLSGTDITDSGVYHVVRHMQILVKLELAYCSQVSDNVLTGMTEAKHLGHVVLTGCHQLTNKVLEPLKDLHSITILEVNHCKNVSSSICQAVMTDLKGKNKSITICYGQTMSSYPRLADIVNDLIEL
ncbi:DgyrCDS9592 [Dimorphilus gyrociliatus]|uniref:[histone H3]-dimethyl-L-lysine(36) demethylase n=1 Tax=Dimorphilus gyrociliatus TaxID=2664684 RepID=A0A7I8VXF6_9ANNE|nr:DgyrCDS9592 [Dimorphilus gyrociliatus]